MVTGAKAEAIVGTPEVIDGAVPIEASPVPGDYADRPALDARIATMIDFPPLGPPDIVYVRKRFRPSVMGATKIYGYYHFIRGADVSSPAALAAYIYQLLNVGLDPAPWLAAGTWEVIGASIHSYNVMEERDAVVDITLPGGVTACSIGPDGDVSPATSEAYDMFWKETSVSAVVRAIANVGESPLYPCMRAIPPLPNPEAEDAFLESAAACIKRWHLSGTDRPGVENASTANSRIATAIADYFFADARYSRALAFFDSDKILVADPETGAHAAHAANRAGCFEAATRIVSTVLELNPKAGQAWLARSETLLAEGDKVGAMDAAIRATECNPDDLVAWITVAKMHVTEKKFDAALVALNSADMPPPPLDPYLRQLVPNRRRLTTPLKGGDTARAGAVHTLASTLKDEKSASGTRADELLADLPAKLMSSTEREVYSVLVDILNEIGWDSLLAIRGRCFVMEADIAAARSDENSDLAQSSPVNGSAAQVDNAGVVPDNHPSGSSSDEIRPADASSAPSHERGSSQQLQIQSAPSKDVTLEITDASVQLASVSLDNGDLSEDVTATHGANANGNMDKDLDEDSVSSDSDTGLPISRQALEVIGKKVCKPWLDYLVTNLYEDLRAMAVWNAEEQLHRKTSDVSPSAVSPGEAAAAALREDDDVEQGVVDDSQRIRTADEVAGTTRRPPVDWLRRGDLALRLKKTEDAKTAYWVCVKLSDKAKLSAVSALVNIMTLCAREGDAGPALRCADVIWNFIDVTTERQATVKTMDAHSEAAVVVRNAVHQLIAKVGLNKVRSSMPSRMDVNHSRLEGLLLDSVTWKVQGYDR